MIKNNLTRYLKTLNQNIDVGKLPEAAQRELATFYEFLVFKYLGKYEQSRKQKQQILTKIFQEADGKLPEHYRFNREELHER